ncbi:hypothetical protein M9458_008689, partial [Cirrhinus mrigala]
SPVSIMTERTNQTSDSAGSDHLRAALHQQGVMLGSQATQLNAARREVEGLNAQMADLMLQVTELRQAVGSGGLSSPASHGNFPEPHANSPLLYNGDPNSCRSFLAQCALVFSLQTRRYATEEARIAFILTLLTGRALEWGIAVWENQAPCCRSFRAFHEDMMALFDRSARGDEAAAQLSQLSQRRLASSLADPPLSSVRAALVCPVVPSPWVQEDPAPAPPVVAVETAASPVVAVEAAAPLEASDNAAAPHSRKRRRRRRRRKKTSSSLQDSEVVPELTADRGVVLALTKLLALPALPKLLALPAPPKLLALPVPSRLLALPTPPKLLALPVPSGLLALPTPSGLLALPAPPKLLALPAPPKFLALPVPPKLLALPTPPKLPSLPLMLAPPSNAQLALPRMLALPVPFWMQA